MRTPSYPERGSKLLHRVTARWRFLGPVSDIGKQMINSIWPRERERKQRVDFWRVFLVVNQSRFPVHCGSFSENKQLLMIVHHSSSSKILGLTRISLNKLWKSLKILCPKLASKSLSGLQTKWYHKLSLGDLCGGPHAYQQRLTPLLAVTKPLVIVEVDCHRLPSVGIRGARRGPSVDTSEAISRSILHYYWTPISWVPFDWLILGYYSLVHRPGSGLNAYGYDP